MTERPQARDVQQYHTATVSVGIHIMEKETGSRVGKLSHPRYPVSRREEIFFPSLVFSAALPTPYSLSKET